MMYEILQIYKSWIGYQNFYRDVLNSARMLTRVRSNPPTSVKIAQMIAMPIRSAWKNSITGKGVLNIIGNPISKKVAIASPQLMANQYVWAKILCQDRFQDYLKKSNNHFSCLK